MLGIKHDGHSDCSTALLPNIRSLAASGRIYNPINSDQLYETQSSILEINRVLTIGGAFRKQAWFCGHFDTVALQRYRSFFDGLLKL